MSHRIRKSLLAALSCAALLCSSPVVREAGAQILRVPQKSDTRRAVYASLSVGFLETQDRFDGQSGVYWELGQAISYRASLETGIRAGAIGVSASLASVPISRRTATPSASSGDIQLRQYLATFRTPETQGMFQVIEIGLGLGQWAGYSGTDVLSAEERKARNSLAMAIGYGIGFKVGDRMAITLVQDLGTLIGSKEGIPAGVSRAVRQYTTRVGGRIRLSGR